ncbi:hypothetical protein Aasi_1621 [Candidatus Amoebophilus asiaticus 5a2]|uniref:Uncharacterized protein n=1 Tax=Amoebophilus asiaticus (strain 5a2) TaxID=452471 RepID=C3L4L7_AMOA5|nr:hypothetical protein Aasi_1621 [Candidatus Amoebophilus asiaticus 5a2]
MGKPKTYQKRKKEWAYADFFVAMSRASSLCIASDDSSLIGISDSDCGIVVFQPCR